VERRGGKFIEEGQKHEGRINSVGATAGGEKMDLLGGRESFPERSAQREGKDVFPFKTERIS